MEEESHRIPCSSIAVHAAFRVGTAGAIWGAVDSSRAASVKGLRGISKASFVAKSAATCSFQCGLLASVFQLSSCLIERFRGQKDWKNSVIAGVVVAGAANVVSRRKKMDGLIMLAFLLSGVNAAVDSSLTD